MNARAAEVSAATATVRTAAATATVRAAAPNATVRAAAAPAPARATGKEHRLQAPVLWGCVVLVLILWGSRAHLERYITPERGLGYWLGIIGGSMMLLLLVYSARKRASWLRWLGSIPAWFELHMVLGVAGPVLVLFHANFSLGATNSNIALFCMLLVAGSGVIGRYFYTRIHARLDGEQDSLETLQAVAERIRTQTTAITFLPGLLDALDAEEQRLMHPSEGRIGRALHVFTSGLRAALARYRVHRQVRRAVLAAVARDPAVIRPHARRIATVARSYADRRLDACRRVAEYRLYTRLFSFWHVLHIPLFFMLLIAGIAHVIAVNVYY